MKTSTSRQTDAGFTLLEVMLVLLIIGIAVSVVMYNAFSASKQDHLEEQVRRFQVVFDMASDFAVLNQLQMGVRVEQEEAQYYFVYLDEEDNWQPLEMQDAFAKHTLPEEFDLEITLDDLPWEEPDSLFDDSIFDETLSLDNDRVSIGDEEEEPPPPPQIILLSSGDITSFQLVFKYEPNFGNEDPVYFRLDGQESVPLTRVGPLDSL